MAATDGLAKVRASPLRVVLLVGVAGATAALAVLLAIVAASLIDGSIATAFGAFAVAALLIWRTVGLAGAALAAARCRVVVSSGMLSAVCVVPERRWWPRLRAVDLPADTLASVAEAQQIATAFLLPEVRRCAWIVTRAGDAHVIASSRGGGPGSLPVERVAAAVARAAGLPSASHSGTAFQSVGRFGGAELVDAGARAVGPSVDVQADPGQKQHERREAHNTEHQAPGEHAAHASLPCQSDGVQPIRPPPSITIGNPMSRVAFICLAFLASGPAWSMTGKDMAPLCTSNRKLVQMYVSGLGDAYTDPGLDSKMNFCILKTTDDAMTDAFCNILAKRPGELFLPAAVLAHRGFAEAFPCSKGQ